MSGTEPNKCKNRGCRETFRWRTQLSRHRKVCKYPPPNKSYVSQDGVYRCTKCNETFSQQSNASRHKTQGCKPKKVTIKCEICSKSFKYKSLLKQHILVTKNHTKNCCSVCNAHFRKKKSFENHISRCTPDNPHPPAPKKRKTAPSEYPSMVDVDGHRHEGSNDNVDEHNDMTYSDVDEHNDMTYSDVDEHNDMTYSDVDEHRHEGSIDNVDEHNDMTYSDVDEHRHEGSIGNLDDIPTCSYDMNEISNSDIADDSTSDLHFERITECEYTDCSSIANINDRIIPGSQEERAPQIENGNALVERHEELDIEKEISTDLLRTPTQGKVSRNRNVSRDAKRSIEAVISKLKECRTPVRVKAAKTVVETVAHVAHITSVHEGVVLDGLFEHMISLKRRAQGNGASRAKYGELFQFIYRIYGEKTEDPEFIRFLGGRIKVKDIPRFIESFELWKDRNFEYRTPSHALTPAQKELICSTWIENTTVSTDKNNTVRMRKMLYLKQYGDITFPDTNLTEILVRKVPYISTNRLLLACTVRDVHKSLKEEKGLFVSLGTVLQLKPFFVTYPCERERACCQCALCLNTHTMYKSLCRLEKKEDAGNPLPQSLSEFFMIGRCSKTNIGYFAWECCDGTCKTCKGKRKPTLKCVSSEKEHTVNIFERVTRTYEKLNMKTKKKETKTSKRIERVPKLWSPKCILDNLWKERKRYLCHQFEVSNDKYHWPKILSNRSIGEVFHMDFSENMQEQFKNAPQSTHFGKRQYTLHCTVRHCVDGSNKYEYHLSDDLRHDNAFVQEVFSSLIEADGSPDGIIRIKSDNCCIQYKCGEAFWRWQGRAKTLNRPTILYYGIPGHGKGMVDAMSSWGAKKTIKMAVLKEDKQFRNAQMIRDFLSSQFSTDDSKRYYLIRQDTVMSSRLNKEERAIKGIQSMRMVSFFSDGSIQVKKDLCSCDFCMVGKFSKCEVEPGKVVLESDITDKDELIDSDDVDIETLNVDADMYIIDTSHDHIADETYDLTRTFTVLDMLKANSNVAVRGGPSDEELFNVFLVDGFVTAEEVIHDHFGVPIAIGERCVRGRFYTRVKNRRSTGYVKYTVTDTSSVLCQDHIVCPSVKLSANGLLVTVKISAVVFGNN